MESGLRTNGAYSMLAELTSKAPHRLSGSADAERAIELTVNMMKERGLDNVHLEQVIVPRWVRGSIEEATLIHSSGGKNKQLSICALGGSVPTPSEGIEGSVVEVRSFEELRALNHKVNNKIVFFNRAMDGLKLNTRDAYKGAVNQRNLGAAEAAQYGAIGVLVRSMTLSIDTVPHTGSVIYKDSVVKIPAAAISTKDADLLSSLLKQGNDAKVNVKLTCQTLPDVRSWNVIGEITGSEKPKDIIVIGAHIDNWDKGSGAHDNGAGCVQAIEALTLLKKAGVQPKKTLRVVLFINEENGGRGSLAYPAAPERSGEAHFAAIESDHGGFAPRGFSFEGDTVLLETILRWKYVFDHLDAGMFAKGQSGIDIQPLVQRGVPGFGLEPENHRYFDYHHSEHDTIDKVNGRELEMGAIVIAMLGYLLSEM